MVGILLQDAVGHLYGLLVLFSFIQLDERLEGGRIFAPQWLRHRVWFVAEGTKLRRSRWSECSKQVCDHQ